MPSSAACFITLSYLRSVCHNLFTYSIINGVSIFFNILLLQTVLLRAFLYISPLSKSRNFSGPQLLGCRVCTFSVLQNSCTDLPSHQQYLKSSHHSTSLNFIEFGG